jgi:glycosyltransferase involved in cell wall biosynthesis
MQPRWAICTPYHEGSILALARHAAASGRLTRLYTTSSLGRLRPVAERVPDALGGRRASAFVARRSAIGIPPELVGNVGWISELARVVTAGLPFPRSLPTSLMYRSKARFDEGVSARLGGLDVDVVVGMFGACRQTFVAAGRTHSVRVLNFVNSHPAVHNQMLRELAGLPDDHPEMVPPSTQRAVEAELELADLVLVPSEFVARQLREAGVAPEKISVHPYGVDPRRFAPAAGPDRPASPSPVRVLFVGQLSHRKGLGCLLDAARSLQDEDIAVTLMGPMVSPDVLVDVPANVTVRPAVGHAEVAEALAGSDIFVMPSLEDAYCLAVLEAMAVGVPVVGTDHVGTSELIQTAGGGEVVAAADPGKLAQALSALAHDPARRRAAGAAARDAMSAGPTWDDYAEGVAARVDRLVTGQAGQASP